EEDVLLAVEVGEDRARRDVGRLCDVGERRVVIAPLGEQLQRYTLDRVACLLFLAFPQSELGRGVERAHFCGAYQQTFTQGNFAMTVDFCLHTLYKCTACKIATRES